VTGVLIVMIWAFRGRGAGFRSRYAYATGHSGHFLT
jgi:hypothetical protein